MGNNTTFRDRYTCERCGADDVLETTYLAGVYRARLCLDCVNAWDPFIRPHDLWRARQALEARGIMIASMTEADGFDRTDELIQAVNDADRVNTQIWLLAQAWVRGTKEDV
jgi:hypothetical protein